MFSKIKDNYFAFAPPKNVEFSKIISYIKVNWYWPYRAVRYLPCRAVRYSPCKALTCARPAVSSWRAAGWKRPNSPWGRRQREVSVSNTLGRAGLFNKHPNTLFVNYNVICFIFKSVQTDVLNIYKLLPNTIIDFTRLRLLQSYLLNIIARSDSSNLFHILYYGWYLSKIALVVNFRWCLFISQMHLRNE